MFETTYVITAWKGHCFLLITYLQEAQTKNLVMPADQFRLLSKLLNFNRVNRATVDKRHHSYAVCRGKLH
jgi:3-hydroxymyristoyl/3-hydroxydecanoyl-(acyl carrier protein) dehydratase